MTGDFLCHPNDFANRVFVQTILKTLEHDTEEAYIAGLADRITKYRYEAEYDAADWASLQSLAATASAEIAACATADEARAKYIEHAAILDEIPTSAENIANSTLDASALIFANSKPMDTVTEATNLVATFSDFEKAMSIVISNARNPYATIDYTVCDTGASADDYSYVVLTLRAPTTNGSRAKQTKLTYTTSEGTCGAVTATLVLDGEYHSYVIDMSEVANWSGDIKSVKFQPFASCSVNDELYVSSVILAADAETAADIAIERERVANNNAAEAVTYLMSDDATTAVLTVPAGESYFAGDANGDGKISAVDSLSLRIYLVDEGYEVVNAKALDVNCDGAINAVDSALMRSILAGKTQAAEISGADAAISYSSSERAAEIKLNKDNVTVTVDLSDKGLSGDMFKYLTVCAKDASGEALRVTVTLNWADGTASKAVTVPSTELFGATVAKFTEAGGNIVSVEFTFDAVAGDTIYLDSFVFTPTVSAAENAVAVRVGAANLYS